MSDENEENIVVKSIINKFLAEISDHSEIPSDLVREIENLRHEKKIGKGNNLKNLLIDIGEERAKDEV